MPFTARAWMRGASVLLLCLASALGSCVSVKDISSSAPVSKSRIIGKVYRLEREAYLLSQWPEYPGMEVVWFNLERISGFTVIATLRPGTRFEITGVRHVNVPPTHSNVVLMAKASEAGSEPRVVGIADGFAELGNGMIPGIACIGDFGPMSVPSDLSSALRDLASSDWPVRFGGVEGIRRLKRDDDTVTEAIAARLGVEEDPDVRWRLLSTLTQRGASMAIRELCRVLSRKDLAGMEISRCRDLLEAQGPRAIEEITKTLSTLGPGDDGAFASCHAVLTQIGPAAKIALPELLRAMRRVRYQSVVLAEGLARIDPGTAVDLLMSEGLRDVNPSNRERALKVLSGLGDAATPALPEIQRLAETDPSMDVRRVASSVAKNLSDHK